MPTVVIPTYNESESLPKLIDGLRAAVPDVSILIVDDGSPDGTAGIARGMGATVLERECKSGLASAYILGFKEALSQGAELIVQMDADLSHDPKDVPRLIAKTTDLVLGSRYVTGGGTVNWPLHRKAVSRFGSAWARYWLGLPVADLTGGFKCWTSKALTHVLSTPLRSEGYSFQVEMTWRAIQGGFSVEEVPIIFTERIDGVSKMSNAIALEAAWLIPALRFRS